MNRPEENIFAQERKQLIVDLVNRRVKVTVSELCEEFGVSPATVRNDLRELELTGLLRRTHGGAISNAKITFDLPYTERLVKNQAEKQLIGKYAADMVEEGDKIIIDIGTTTREMAIHLVNRKKLTVITNDLEVVRCLQTNPGIDIIMTGGYVRPGFNTLYGQFAIDALQHLYVDKAFISVEGIDLERGATNTDFNVALVKKEFISHSDRAIFLCDSSKFGKTAFIKFAEIEDINTIITDAKVDAKTMRQYQERHVEIKVAQE